MRGHDFGKRGEELAAQYLRKHGYKILDRNFRAHHGEIDIIAKDKKQFVFVEVKSRTSSFFGTPIESIHTKKMESFVRTAQFFLQKYKKEQESYRFDAIEVAADGDKVSINHVKNITL